MLTGETENVTNARASQLEVSESERERLIKRTTHFYPPKEGKKTAQVPLCFFVALPLSDKKNSLWLRGPPAGYRLEERPSDIMAGFQFGGQKKLSIFHCQGVALTAVCSVRTDGTYLFFAKICQAKFGLIRVNEDIEVREVKFAWRHASIGRGAAKQGWVGVHGQGVDAVAKVFRRV